MQVAQLEYSCRIYLPPLHSLRHLILKASGEIPFPLQSLSGMPTLETLSLASGDYSYGLSSNPMDVSSLLALKHLHLCNLVPVNLAVPSGCSVHASWGLTMPATAHAESNALRHWLARSCVWTASFRLASLRIMTVWPLDLAAFSALEVALSMGREIEHLTLAIPCLGTDEEPLLVSTDKCRSLALARTLSIKVQEQCSIKIMGLQPAWKNLSLECPLISLEVDDHSALTRDVEEFQLRTTNLQGDLGIKLALGLSRCGRKFDVKRLESSPAGSIAHSFFTFGTLMDPAAQKRFKKLMACSCHSCLHCLQREKKLPKRA